MNRVSITRPTGRLCLFRAFRKRICLNLNISWVQSGPKLTRFTVHRASASHFSHYNTALKILVVINAPLTSSSFYFWLSNYFMRIFTLVLLWFTTTINLRWVWKELHLFRLRSTQTHALALCANTERPVCGCTVCPCPYHNHKCPNLTESTGCHSQQYR